MVSEAILVFFLDWTCWDAERIWLQLDLQSISLPRSYKRFILQIVHYSEVTRVFIFNVELWGVIKRYDGNPGWTENELFALQSQIAQFKKIDQSVFAWYQASSMGIQKWHVLDHIAECIKTTLAVFSIFMEAYTKVHIKFSKPVPEDFSQKNICYGRGLRAPK